MAIINRPTNASSVVIALSQRCIAREISRQAGLGSLRAACGVAKVLNTAGDFGAYSFGSVTPFCPMYLPARSA
jgi:hypothetical protein